MVWHISNTNVYGATAVNGQGYGGGLPDLTGHESGRLIGSADLSARQTFGCLIGWPNVRPDFQRANWLAKSPV